MKLQAIIAGALALGFMTNAQAADAPERARDLGVPFTGVPGPLNAITDVAGVTVGQETLIRDLKGGKAVRTGVTAILPKGASSMNSTRFA